MKAKYFGRVGLLLLVAAAVCFWGEYQDLHVPRGFQADAAERFGVPELVDRRVHIVELFDFNHLEGSTRVAAYLGISFSLAGGVCLAGAVALDRLQRPKDVAQKPK
jgi:hypothetical protein